MATKTVRVKGLRELDLAFKAVSRDTQKGLREELTVVAEPVRFDAETLATSRIRNIGPMRAKSWARMRTGQARNVVYVAPKRRGRNHNPNLRRPKFAQLLMDRAMQPALDENQSRIVQRLDLLLDILARKNGF